jgi:hypothetical protein
MISLRPIIRNILDHLGFLDEQEQKNEHTEAELSHGFCQECAKKKLSEPVSLWRLNNRS